MSIPDSNWTVDIQIYFYVPKTKSKSLEVSYVLKFHNPLVKADMKRYIVHVYTTGDCCYIFSMEP